MFSHFHDPLMWDPFFNKVDPWNVFDSDPFFQRPLLGQRLQQQQLPQQPQEQQQGLLGDTEMNKDSSALTAPTTGTGQEVSTTGGRNNVGFWNFNRYLNEPLTLGLEDKEDKYVMNVVRPMHIGDHDLKIDIKNDILTVHGEKKEEQTQEDKEKGSKSFRSSFTSFSRSIRLPANVDQAKIMAHMEQPGRLIIELPKIQEHGKDLKQIPISRAGGVGGGNLNESAGGGVNQQQQQQQQQPTQPTSTSGTAHNLRHKK